MVTGSDKEETQAFIAFGEDFAMKQDPKDLGWCHSDSGWWYSCPSEKYEFVNWDDDIPN